MSVSVECPNCDAPLPATGGCRRCNWAPTPTPRAPGTHEPNRCRCGDTSPSSSEFYDDEAAHPEDRGVRLCPVCWISALKRRALRDPISDHDRARLLAQLRASLTQIEERTRAL